jgi:hypothetical protein
MENMKMDEVEVTMTKVKVAAVTLHYMEDEKPNNITLRSMAISIDTSGTTFRGGFCVKCDGSTKIICTTKCTCHGVLSGYLSKDAIISVKGKLGVPLTYNNKDKLPVVELTVQASEITIY